MVRALNHSIHETGIATPIPDAISGASSRRSRSARHASHAAIGSANAAASTGRTVAANPSASPHPNALRDRRRNDALDTVARSSASNAAHTPSNVGTWFICEPDMNSMYGANANSNDASSDTPGRSASTPRVNAEKHHTARAPHSGTAIHAAPSSTPNRQHAGPAGRKLREHATIALDQMQGAEQLGRLIQRTGDASRSRRCAPERAARLRRRATGGREDPAGRQHVEGERREDENTRRQARAFRPASNERIHAPSFHSRSERRDSM